MTFQLKAFALASMLAASALAAPALAQDASRLSLGVTAGSIGVGPEVSYALTPKLSVRADATFLSIHHAFNTSDLRYAGEVDLSSGGAAIDFKPFGGPFFVSAGARFDGDRLKAVATPSGAVTLNGVTYAPAQIGVLSAKAEFPSVAPTLSVGYRFHPTRHVVFGLEAGAMFMGAARISTPTYTGAGIAAADLEVERAKLNSQVDRYQTYPVLQAALGYRF